MCGYSFIAAPLRYGSIVTLLAALFIACGAMLLLGLILERRLLRPRVMALAFTVGDPALALSISFGIRAAGPNPPCGVVDGPVGQLTAAFLWLLFGVWQWASEVKTGIYTRQQAVSPTKIWHQLVVYPALGTWTLVATADGLLNVSRAPWPTLLMIPGLAIWAGTLVHNARHPRLGHPPYDWSHLRPAPQPWGVGSVTLRSSTGRKASAK